MCGKTKAWTQLNPKFHATCLCSAIGTQMPHRETEVFFCSLLWPHHPAQGLVQSMSSISTWCPMHLMLRRLTPWSPSSLSLCLYPTPAWAFVTYFFPQGLGVALPYHFVCSLSPGSPTSQRSVPTSHSPHHAFYDPVSHFCHHQLWPWVVLDPRVSSPNSQEEAGHWDQKESVPLSQGRYQPSGQVSAWQNVTLPAVTPDIRINKIFSKQNLYLQKYIEALILSGRVHRLLSQFLLQWPQRKETEKWFKVQRATYVRNGEILILNYDWGVFHI